MYGDFSMQAIYADNKSEEEMLDLLEDGTSFVRFRLTLNCRNTQEIADALCTGGGLEDLGVTGRTIHKADNAAQSAVVGRHGRPEYHDTFSA